MDKPKKNIVFAPKSSAKVRDGQFGAEVKLSFQADALIEFVQANTNARGYINFEIVPRREVGQFGDTHSVRLDTWEPGQSNGQASGGSQQKASKPQAAAPAPSVDEPAVDGDDDIPF